MRFRDKIINDIDSKIWNKQKITIRKSNNLSDYNANVSKDAKNDKIKDDIATKIGKTLNTNVFNLFGSQTTYRKRIEQYEHIANFPEIDEALDIICNEIVNFGFNNKIIRQDFTSMGDENIDSETKSAINKIFDDILVKNYNIRKRFKKDVKKLLIYGELYYQKVLDTNNKNLYEVRYINPKNMYPVFWNNEPIFFIEMMDYESLDSDELDILADNIDTIIQDKIGTMMSANMFGQKTLDPTNLPNTYQTLFNSEAMRSSVSEQNAMYKLYNAQEIIYVRWDEDVRDKNSVISYLDKLKVPFNRLQTMENQLLLFRMTRSVLSYVINLDVGDVSQRKREELLDAYIDDFNAQEEYNSSTGFMEEVKSVQTAIKHWWFTKGGDIGGSDVQTLDVKADFDQIGDILHFQTKFLRALKIPVHRWENRKESTTQNFMSGEVINEELEFNNFIANIKIMFEPLFVNMLQTRMFFEGFTETVMNESNFELIWSEKNFYRLFVNKTITETYADMAEKLKEYYTPEMILKEVFEKTDSEFIDILKARVRHKKHLQALWSDEGEITPELELYLENEYFNSNEDYESKLVKKDNNKDTITPEKKRDDVINYFANAINYIKKTIKDVELENINLIGIK